MRLSNGNQTSGRKLKTETSIHKLPALSLQKDGKTCANGPTNFLILAHRVDIRQISLDVPYTADVVLPFPQLKRATSVDVDRKTGEIYWTDTLEDVIQKSKPDGSNMQTIIMHQLQAPDGIAIDSAGRKVYVLAKSYDLFRVTRLIPYVYQNFISDVLDRWREEQHRSSRT